MRGLVNGTRAWFLTRTDIWRPSPIKGVWLPGNFADTNAVETDLSPRCLAALGPQIEAFVAEGFGSATYRRTWHSVMPTLTDDGACVLLHSSGLYIASAVYLRHWLPGNVCKETLTLSVGTYLTSGRMVTTINSRQYLDPASGTSIYAVEGGTPKVLLETLKRRIAPIVPGDEQVLITSLSAMQQIGDVKNAEIFAERLRRGVFVPMTEEEVSEARAAQEASIRAEALVG